MSAQKDIYQHFHPNEFHFIEKMSDVIQRVDDNYLLEVTDFLNPREILILKSLVAPTNLNCFSSTDSYSSEYGRVIIAPEYYKLETEDFDMALVEISYNAKFNHLSHAQILGTLINELGIKRSLLGDIYLDLDYAQIMISRKLLPYLLGNISKIARASVTLKEVTFDQLVQGTAQEITLDLTVSSLRLDRLLATVLKLSRSQAIKLIETDKVKCNYQPMDKPSESVAVGDLISIRGFGRFKLLSDNGFTKNGKYKLTISKMMHK
ncbi:YlmH family RNA-binding protein [Streptococcus ictaluri]|uniref:S4 domain protein n=1 Tax=Streptococcus ictaluri 707-05 TaxID=764299 RepID=G5K5Q7_9STRE|nr:RNA-binding protein [Streptococcus ictaluri]EHI68626.1 S4 domain protein [Streptococcus ictaluri 707-05]